VYNDGELNNQGITFMMRPACAALLGLLFALPSFAAELPRITGDEGVTYDDLIREQTLVTIMLKAGAPENNMRIKAIHSKGATPTIEVKTMSGELTAHTFANISYVRVQKERIRAEDKPDPESVLTVEDKAIVTQATDRAMAIFKESHNQGAKMAAASALAASSHPSKADAILYLKGLSASNDAATSLLAATLLWQNGEAPPDPVLLAGFTSGNRGAKSQAAELAGLTNAQQFIVEIRTLLRNPSIEIFPSAAIAVGRLNDRTSLPALFEAIRVITDEKAEAAVVALSLMGGPDVIQKLQDMVPSAKGTERFRIVRVLHALGDKNATHLLQTEGMSQPSFQRETALLLAKEGSPEAMKFLREFLVKPSDPDDTNLIYRAEVGLALYSAGDFQQKRVVADVLNVQPIDIYARGKTSDKQYKEAAVRKIQSEVSRMLGASMRRDLLSMLTAPLQSQDLSVAISAAQSIVAISNHEYGKRIIESSK
jgi:HEAT repeat protein